LVAPVALSDLPDPDPERDDDGKVVDAEDYFVEADTSIELPFMPYNQRQ